MFAAFFLGGWTSRRYQFLLLYLWYSCLGRYIFGIFFGVSRYVYLGIFRSVAFWILMEYTPFFFGQSSCETLGWGKTLLLRQECEVGSRHFTSQGQPWSCASPIAGGSTALLSGSGRCCFVPIPATLHHSTCSSGPSSHPWSFISKERDY